MKLGLFGGSFDPVHNGHVEMAKKALEVLNLSQLIFVPTPQNPLKEQSPIANNQHRTEMLKLVAALDERFVVSEVEVGADQLQKDPAYSIDTVIYYAGLNQLNKSQLFFLIGIDSLSSLHQWKDYDQLFTFCTIVVFGRDGQTSSELKNINSNLTEEQLKELYFIEFDYKSSSTALRKDLRAENFDEVADRIDSEVLGYIKNHALYQK